MKGLFFMPLAFLVYINTNAQIADSAKREIKLAGAANFRDLGGYATTDGHHVKWGKIYRSAALNALTEEDLRKLKSLNISIDADFRGPYEVGLAPDKIPDGTHRISLPAGSEETGTLGGMKKMLAARDKDSAMVAFYSNTQVFRDRYKPVFEELLRISPDSALLFHCSAGKDRTGMAAALVLYALGVPENTIMEDYLASNYYRKAVIQKDSAQMVDRFGIAPDAAKGLAGVKKEYLIASYQAITEKYGSINNFLRTEIGLDEEKIHLLRTKFLE
ncbi:MAG: tyrosine-protein phosphatase [Chitinophagaceae bacterium]